MRNPSNLRTLLILSLCFNFVIVGLSYFIGKRIFYYERGQPENRSDIIPQKKGFITYMVNVKDMNMNAVNMFKMLPHKPTDIVFLGTSLTQGFPLQEMFADCRLKNRGIGGNTTNDILARLTEVTNGRPAKVFLEAGTNDIGHQIATDSIFGNFVKIIKIIKKASPLTKVYVQSVLPFGNNNEPSIVTYNNKVNQYCIANNLTYINLYPLYLRNLTLNKDYTTDGTHLNSTGYFIWANKIKNSIYE